MLPSSVLWYGWSSLSLQFSRKPFYSRQFGFTHIVAADQFNVATLSEAHSVYLKDQSHFLWFFSKRALARSHSWLNDGFWPHYWYRLPGFGWFTFWTLMSRKRSVGWRPLMWEHVFSVAMTHRVVRRGAAHRSYHIKSQIQCKAFRRAVHFPQKSSPRIIYWVNKSNIPRFSLPIGKHHLYVLYSRRSWGECSAESCFQRQRSWSSGW